MHEISPIAAEKGTAILSLLKEPKNLLPKLFRFVHLTAEDNSTAIWPIFVKFPDKLSRLFPGSYIAPGTFLRELGVDGKQINEEVGKLLSNSIGGEGNTTFQTVQERKDNLPAFNLSVLNGLTNEHALAMTRLAYNNGITDADNRAQYQYHMYSSIEPHILDPSEPKYGVRFFDDCIASGDSLAGYLYRLYQEQNPLLKKGVEIVAVTATSQSILFLKNFAKSLNIDLTIKVGQVAFGLTEGIDKENGVKEHANYITYPPELLALLPEAVVSQLRQLEIMVGTQKVIQVVGDMGEAGKGIDDNVMRQIREGIGKELGMSNFCWWNDTREDSHGEHPNHHKLQHPKTGYKEKPLLIYLARGGYLPFEWDKRKYPHFGIMEKIIERASRLWTKEFGYGVGMKD